MAGDTLDRKNRKVTYLVLIVLLFSTIPMVPSASADDGLPGEFQAQEIEATFDPVSEETTITWRNIADSGGDFDLLEGLWNSTYHVYRSSEMITSENVAIASQNNGVKKCILISTDKACQPVNVYGSSKFIAERIFTNYDYNSESTVFASVRYGNVIASRGSFIPLWMEAISEGKRMNVTSMEMTRFLFTLSDAVDTVLKSLYYAEGGEVFIPKINSFKMQVILDSIKKLVGKDDVQTKIIGVRPGEKLHEDMLAKTELPFTYQPDDKLLTVIPQYTNKSHTYSKKYDGKEFNSSLHNNDNVDDLCELIKKGIAE